MWWWFIGGFVAGQGACVLAFYIGTLIHRCEDEHLH